MLLMVVAMLRRTGKSHRTLVPIQLPAPLLLELLELPELPELPV